MWIEVAKKTLDFVLKTQSLVTGHGGITLNNIQDTQSFRSSSMDPIEIGGSLKVWWLPVFCFQNQINCFWDVPILEILFFMIKIDHFRGWPNRYSGNNRNTGGRILLDAIPVKCRLKHCWCFLHCEWQFLCCFLSDQYPVVACLASTWQFFQWQWGWLFWLYLRDPEDA